MLNKKWKMLATIKECIDKSTGSKVRYCIKFPHPNGGEIGIVELHSCPTDTTPRKLFDVVTDKLASNGTKLNSITCCGI